MSSSSISSFLPIIIVMVIIIVIIVGIGYAKKKKQNKKGSGKQGGKGASNAKTPAGGNNSKTPGGNPTVPPNTVPVGNLCTEDANCVQGAGCCDGKCTTLVKDWTRGYVCPAICRSGPAGSRGEGRCFDLTPYEGQTIQCETFGTIYFVKDKERLKFRNEVDYREFLRRNPGAPLIRLTCDQVEGSPLALAEFYDSIGTGTGEVGVGCTDDSNCKNGLTCCPVTYGAPNSTCQKRVLDWTGNPFCPSACKRSSDPNDPRGLCVDGTPYNGNLVQIAGLPQFTFYIKDGKKYFVTPDQLNELRRRVPNIQTTQLTQDQVFGIGPNPIGGGTVPFNFNLL